MIGKVNVRNRREVTFEKKNGILYRILKHTSVNRGEPVRQVVVPKPLRKQVMHLAHNSLMGRHMGIRKTTDQVLTNSYWPAVQEDVTRYCRSCDVCQRNVRKATVPRAPLQRMPLIYILAIQESGRGHCWSYPSSEQRRTPINFDASELRDTLPGGKSLEAY